MTVVVVDLFEVIDVQDYAAEHTGLAAHAHEFLLQRIHQKSACIKSREVVGNSDLEQLFLRCAQLGHGGFEGIGAFVD